MCAMCFYTCEGKDSVEQTTREMTANEGHKVTLQCNFSTSDTSPYLFWYKQLPNTSPTFILSEFTFGKGTTEPEYQKRFSATLNSTTQTVSLIIGDVDVSDSAVYYCALRPTVTKHTQHSHKNTE
ncbi:T-cell receptor alpha variable region TCRa-V54 [Triplophysa rosa]|nr:T-cell receptor alpha variable region TCRa-V54 [Triplophysa rosa]